MKIIKNTSSLNKKDLINTFKTEFEKHVFSLDSFEVTVSRWDKVSEYVEFPIFNLVIHDNASKFININDINIVFGTGVNATFSEYSITYLQKILDAVENASAKTLKYIERILREKGAKNGK